jgi:hypothetical protein
MRLLSSNTSKKPKPNNPHKPMLVNINDSLIKRIKSNINQHLDQECKATFGATAVEYISGGLKIGPALESFLDHALWGKHLHFKQEIPREWMVKLTDTITVSDKHAEFVRYSLTNEFSTGPRYEDRYSVVSREMTPKKLAFIVQLPKPYMAPPGTEEYNFTVRVDRNCHPEVAAVFAKASECVALCKKWADTEEKVVKFLNSVKSLNEGVKIWPELRSFLDPADAARLDRKVERNKTVERESKAKEILASIDTQQIIADVVNVKLCAA